MSADRRGLWRAAAVVVALVVVAAVGWAVVRGSDDPPVGRRLVSTSDYRAGRAADLYLPDGRAPAPVVVLVPGGGWVTADRTGLRPLAEQLAGAGAVAAVITYRAAEAGGRFPGPVQDVECAVDVAVARARAAGVPVGPVVLLGHSAGAHLAAVSALAGPGLRGRCRSPHVPVDALVGLSGPYDVRALPEVARPLFGVDLARAPLLWRAGDPYAWLGRPVAGRSLRVLLVHGGADPLVPVGESTAFAAALRRSGHPVRLVVLPGVDHQGTVSPARVGALVTRWVTGLTRTGVPASSSPSPR